MLELSLATDEAALTTAATDGLLGLAVVAGLGWLHRRTPPSWRRSVWTTGLALFAVAAVLGVIAHGLELEPRVRKLMWQPLWISLGVAAACFAAGALADWRGELAARRTLPWLLGAAALFYAATWFSGGAYLMFVLFETAVLVFALVAYITLATAGRPGATSMIVGLVLSLVGGAVQASRLSIHVGWELDHNGLYHLIQLVGVLFIIIGLRGTLSSTGRA